MIKPIGGLDKFIACVSEDESIHVHEEVVLENMIVNNIQSLSIGLTHFILFIIILIYLRY